jgi:glyoxylase-like metal-dependent hydrolase (beta-lactamase superfamily II)
VIIKQLDIGYMDNFCYIVGCERTRKALVIDPGHDVDQIVSAAEKQGLVIETIVNTHAHGDHTAGNAELKSLTGAKIIIHALDAAGYPKADVFWRMKTPCSWARSPSMSFILPATPPAAFASMRKETSLRATPCLSVTAAAPTCPAAIAPLWADPSAA